MTYQFGYDATDQLVMRIARRFFLAHFDGRFALLAGSYFVLLILLTMIAGPMVAGVFWGITLLLFVLIPVAYFIRAHQSKRVLAKFPHPHVSWTIRDDALVRSSPLGEATMPWRLFDTVKAGPDVWLFLIHRSLAAAIPAEHIQLEAAAFMRERLRSAGVRVIG